MKGTHKTHIAACISGATFSLLSLAASSNPVPGQPAPTYLPGEVVAVLPLQSKPRRTLNPAQHAIGYYVSSANPYGVDEPLSKDGLNFYKQDTAQVRSSWFRVEHGGDYLFSPEIEVPPVVLFTNPQKGRGARKGRILCEYRLNINGEALTSLSIDTKSNNVSNDQRYCGFTQSAPAGIKLEPGVYKFQQFLSCRGGRKVKGKDPKSVNPPQRCPNADQVYEFGTKPHKDVRIRVRVRGPDNKVPVLMEPSDLSHISKDKNDMTNMEDNPGT